MCGIFLYYQTTPTAWIMNKTKGEFVFNISNSYSEMICLLRMLKLYCKRREIHWSLNQWHLFLEYVPRNVQKDKNRKFPFSHVGIHSCTGRILAPLRQPPFFSGSAQAFEEAWWCEVSAAPVKMPNVQQRQAAAVELPGVNVCEAFPTRQLKRRIRFRPQSGDGLYVSGDSN